MARLLLDEARGLGFDRVTAPVCADLAALTIALRFALIRGTW